MLKTYPFYVKSTIILFGLCLFVVSIFTLRSVLVPLSFGLLLAILLNPVINRLQKWKFPKVPAIAVALLIAIVLLAAIIYFISMQIASFSDQLPVLKKKSMELLHKFQRYLDQKFNLNMKSQDDLIKDAKAGLKPVVGQTLGTVAGSVELMLLVPLYSFLFLYYKTLILNFLYEVFAEENSKRVNDVLVQTKGAVQSYMFGLLLEALIVAILNSIALMILGVQYAILLGVLGAILNILPFIGGITAVLLPLIIATITGTGFGTQLGIIIAYLIIQFVDNHFLVPYIVSSKVKINALISIIIVLLGALVWGIAGMFLSIPFIGVLKIIFDRIPDLKPWGKLLGDEIPTRHRGQGRILKKEK